jgi:hypothetical protein
MSARQFPEEANNEIAMANGSIAQRLTTRVIFMRIAGCGVRRKFLTTVLTIGYVAESGMPRPRAPTTIGHGLGALFGFSTKSPSSLLGLI